MLDKRFECPYVDTRVPFPVPPSYVTLAVDPGSTTGVAVFRGDRLAETFSTKAPHAGLRARLGRIHPDNVVVEKGPLQRRQPEACAPIERLVMELFGDTVHWLWPAQWKPSPHSRLLEDDIVPLIIHERDAAHIGRFWLHTEGTNAQKETPTRSKDSAADASPGNAGPD